MTEKEEEKLENREKEEKQSIKKKGQKDKNTSEENKKTKRMTHFLKCQLEISKKAARTTTKRLLDVCETTFEHQRVLRINKGVSCYDV